MLASFLASAEAFMHGFLNIPGNVARFISPSRFLISKFVDFGWGEDHFMHLPYCLSSMNSDGYNADEGYALFLGRLESYKGISTLIRAMSANKNIRLKVVGTGSETESSATLISEMQLNNVELTGYLHGEDLRKIVRNCSYIIVPSEWYENYPLVVMEAMAAGKPVIASRIGGLPEMVEEGITGFLFEPRNHSDLSDKMKALSTDKNLRIMMGKNGREKAVVVFDPEKHFENIMRIYSNALNR